MSTLSLIVAFSEIFNNAGTSKSPPYAQIKNIAMVSSR